MKKQKKMTKDPIGLYWVRDREFYRVGRFDWPGDVFEVLTEAEFKELEEIFNRFGIALPELIDEDER